MWVATARASPHIAAVSTTGFTWGDFVQALVVERGSLAAVALHMAQRRDFAEDPESVERGLRRLKGRGSKDGGVWGQRVLRCFGLPPDLDRRVRWMGQYHTRFTDLPTSLGAELVLPFDRPPVSESPARIWLLLARAGLAIRQRADPEPMLEQACLLAERAPAAAQAELALVKAYVFGRTQPDQVNDALQRAGDIIEDETQTMSPSDRACLFARLIDQRAYPLNRPRPGDAPDHAQAYAQYARIPEAGPLFARCRRENGMGWSRLSMGDKGAGRAHGLKSVELAGDAGSLRMRAMALNLVAAASEGAAAQAAKTRAQAIARRLEDEVLMVRFQRG